MNNSIQVRQRVRPCKVAMIIDAGNGAQLEEAARLNCMLWGGAYNPIIPWSPDDENPAVSMIRLFRPDFVHPLCAIPPEAALHNHLPTWPISRGGLYGDSGGKHLSLCDVVEATLGQSAGLTPADYDLRHWQDHDRWNLAKVICIGAYPAQHQARMESVANAKGFAREDISGRPLREVLPLTGPSTVGLTVFGLNVTFNLPPGGLFLGSPTNLGHLLNFWNIRATGIPLLFIDVEDPPSPGICSDWIAKHLDTSWSRADGEPAPPQMRVYHPPDLAPDCLQSAMSAVQGDGDGYDSIRCSADTALANVDGGRVPEVWSRDETILGSVDGRSVRFMLARPSFVAEYSRTPQQVWATDVEFEDPYREEELFGHFPSGSGVRQSVQQWAYHDGAVRSPGLTLYPPTLGEWPQTVVIPETRELVASLLEPVGLTVRVGQASDTVSKLIKRGGGLDRLWYLAIPPSVAVIDSFTDQAASCCKGELLRVLNQALKSESEATEKCRHLRWGQLPKPLELLERLYSAHVLRVGLKVVCAECGRSGWYPLRDLSETFVCRACFSDQPLPSPDTLEWRYRLDGFFRGQGKAHGAATVMVALIALKEYSRQSFAYLAGFEVSEKVDGPVVNEYDFACFSTGSYSSDDRVTWLIGEALGADGKGDKDIRKLATLASRIGYDRDVCPPPFFCIATLAKSFSHEERLAIDELLKATSRVILLSEAEMYRDLSGRRYNDEGRIDAQYIHSWDQLARATQQWYHAQDTGSVSPADGT